MHKELTDQQISERICQIDYTELSKVSDSRAIQELLTEKSLLQQELFFRHTIDEEVPEELVFEDVVSSMYD